MGLPFSVLGKLGVPGLSSLPSGQVYDRHFKDKDTKNFESFHIAFVEFCKYFNTVLPGQDFDTPPLEEVKEFYEKWKNTADDKEKKKAFIDYMTEKVHEAKVDDTLFIMVGLAAPAGAVVAKRAAESIPQAKKFMLHRIPNVVFVPVCTLLAVMGVTAVEVNKKSKAKSPAS